MTYSIFITRSKFIYKVFLLYLEQILYKPIIVMFDLYISLIFYVMVIQTTYRLFYNIYDSFIFDVSIFLIYLSFIKNEGFNRQNNIFIIQKSLVLNRKIYIFTFFISNIKHQTLIIAHIQQLRCELIHKIYIDIFIK